MTFLCVGPSTAYSQPPPNGDLPSADDRIHIYQLPPDRRGGKAYKLVYLLEGSLASCWKFKTDFDNDFLLNNKYIREHRLVSQYGNTVITENKYTHAPDVAFRWQTVTHPEAYRLDFVLLNPKECRQKYHYGSIRLEPAARGTRVTQVAYFDFWGASLWANYPWGGGMKEFLSYTARWEQETLLRLKGRYDNENPR